MSHDEHCTEPLGFPRARANRPGLPRVDYRIGTYAEIREALLRWRDQTPELHGWTHRGADDPGVALLECAAIAGDILTFYQQLYANECWLRTAMWRDSVAELVRLTGYRLAPAIGGHGVFSARVVGDQPVTIPAGYPLTAQLADVPATVTFETSSELVAHAWMNELTLVAPETAPRVTTGTRRLVFAGDPGLRRGDRIDVELNTGNNNDGTIAVVDSVVSRFGETVATMRTPLTFGASHSSVVVRKLGRSFRLFGHNAPDRWVPPGATAAENTPLERASGRSDFPLDTRVPDLERGARLLAVWATPPAAEGEEQRRNVLACTVTQVAHRTESVGPVTAGVTVAYVDGGFGSVHSLRDIEVYEVIGEMMVANAKADPPAGEGTSLRFFGDAAQAAMLADRRWFLTGDGLEAREVRLSVAAAALAQPDTVNLRAVTISEPVPLLAFDRDAATARFLGNVVEASEGATQAEVKLGNGDARRPWQTFRIPKRPLTYLRSAAGDSRMAPELTIVVDGVAWRRVDSLHAAGPGDEVYVVREDDAGDSYVQAGDGVTGRRWPSGIGNVVARYRVGAGAHGELRPGTAARGVRRLPNLDRFVLPGVITGGEPAETAEIARRAAPGKLQSLGRLVSLADYQAETLAQPGVEEAQARWDEVHGVPTIVLTVLMEHGRAAELDALRATLLAAERCRGSRRHPIVVRAGVAEYLYLALSCAFAEGVRRESVEAEIRTILTEQMFGKTERRFGQPEYANRVLGVVQAVPGVRWVTVDAFGSFGVTESDTPRPLPEPALRAATVVCAPDHVLRLEHLHLGAVDGVSVECGP